MRTFDIDVPPDVEMRIARLVEQGDFETETQAIRELLSTGLRAYQTRDSEQEEALYGEEFRQYDDEYIF